MDPQLLAETMQAQSGGIGMMILAIEIALFLFFAFCHFTLAKKMGISNPWMAFIPVLNIYLMVTMAGKPAWWLLLFFVPFVGIVVSIVVLHSIVKLRGHSGWFTLGTLFIPIIFLPILAFESKQA